MILTTSHFDVPQTLKESIAQIFCNGRAGIFLGAGISKPQGLPNWEELIDALFALDGSVRPSGKYSLPQLSEHLLTKKFGDSEERLAAATRKVIYSKVNSDFKSLRENLVLAALASLVMSSRRGAVTEVFTLNYDNLLETYLRYHGYVVRPILDEPSWRGHQDVVIYHPHGYLPIDAKEEASKRITLTQDSYDRIIGKPELPWRQRMLCYLRNNFTIFIGLGGGDGHLSSLLTEVADTHVARKTEKWPYWGIVFTDGTDEVADNHWNKRGIYRVQVNNFHTELPEWLFEICQRAAKLSIQSNGG